MELVEAGEKKIAAIKEKVSSIKMLVYKAKEQASKVEQAFQQMKARHNSVIRKPYARIRSSKRPRSSIVSMCK